MVDTSGERGGAAVRVLVLLVVLGALVLVADAFVRAQAEQRAAEEVTEAIGAPASVALPGTLAGLRALTGEVAVAEIRATDVPVQGPRGATTIDRLDAVARDLRFDVGGIVSGDADIPDIGDARFEATIEAATVEALVEAPLDLAGLELGDDRVGVRLGPTTVEAEVRVVDGTVELVPIGSAFDLLGTTLTVDLSGQPGSPVVDDVAVSPEAMVVRGRLADPASLATARR